MHNKVDYDLLADSQVKKVFIIPRDLNNHKAVCVYESKFLPVNCQALQSIELASNKQLTVEYLSTLFIQNFAKLNSFRTYCKGIRDSSAPCKLLAICKIVSNWNYVSSIKNLPGHIYGTMECINQIKRKYERNDMKPFHIYHSDCFKPFQNSEIYSDFCSKHAEMRELKSTALAKDKVLEKFYNYEISLEQALKYDCETESSTFFGLDSLQDTKLQFDILLTHAKHDLILIHSYSTLKDIEEMFTLHYKITRQKFDLSEIAKDALSTTIYKYQLTLSSSSSDPDVAALLARMDELQAKLNENLDKVQSSSAVDSHDSSNYENYRAQLKKLLIKVKELYSEFIIGNQLDKVAQHLQDAFSGNVELKFEEVQQKTRSLTNSCLQLFLSFDFAEMNTCAEYITSLISLSSTLTSLNLLTYRHLQPSVSDHLHSLVLNYPSPTVNPLAMFSHSRSAPTYSQCAQVMEVLERQVQGLVKKEVQERMEKERDVLDMEKEKGIVRIEVAMQMEQLMKISKSIADKTAKDKQMEEERELKEIQQNFPTYAD